MNKIDNTVMSETLNQFVMQIEQKNARLPKGVQADDFLFPLENEIKENMIVFFQDNAPGFLKAKQLLTSEFSTNSQMTEKQLYNIYNITQNIISDERPLDKEQLMTQMKKEYSEVYDDLYIPGLQKLSRQLNSLIDIKTANTHINVSLNPATHINADIETIKEVALNELKDIEEHRVRHEGLSAQLAEHTIRLTTQLEALDNLTLSKEHSAEIMLNFNMNLFQTISPKSEYQGVDRRSKREPMATEQTADQIYKITSQDIKDFLEKIDPEEVRLKRLEQEMAAERKPREEFANREDFENNIVALRKKHVETPKKEASYRVNI